MSITEVLDKVYYKLSLLDTIERNSIHELPNYQFIEVWKIETEVSSGSFQKEISLLIGFDEFFPLTPPSIFLNEESFYGIYPIPHLDKNRFICTFHTEGLVLDKNNPTGIVKEFIYRAKQIIREGIKEDNNNVNEFKDELGAYWMDYDNSNKSSYLSLLDEYPTTTTFLKCFSLNSTFNGIRYLLYNNSEAETTKKVMDFFTSKGLKGIESNVLFLSNFKLSIKPPYIETNADILEGLDDSNNKLFERYINSKELNKYVLFTSETSSKPILLGWQHLHIDTKRKGYRQGSLKPFTVLSTFQKKDKVIRILPDEYTNNRMENRTSGKIYKKHNFLVAGLGSIGSNLVYFLNGLNYPSFKFIDKDNLRIENIGRHLLGMNNINSYKVSAMKSYIENIRPDQNVSIKTSNLESVVLKDINYFNNCDYAFIAIGNQTIENFLLEKQNESLIKVPMFFLWVEPYAIGGHCLFIHPEDIVSLGDLYENHLYRFNLIDSNEYLNSNPILSKQEAGCQTSYTPYSGNDVILFLSSIYKWINDIIRNGYKKSMAIQWTGNIDNASEIGLKLNTTFENNESFSKITFNIKDEI